MGSKKIAAKAQYVVTARPQYSYGTREVKYLHFTYDGWGHQRPHDWTADRREARTWSEKSGAYKWLKRHAERLRKPPGLERVAVEKSSEP